MKLSGLILAPRKQESQRKRRGRLGSTRCTKLKAFGCSLAACAEARDTFDVTLTLASDASSKAKSFSPEFNLRRTIHLIMLAPGCRPHSPAEGVVGIKTNSLRLDSLALQKAASLTKIGSCGRILLAFCS